MVRRISLLLAVVGAVALAGLSIARAEDRVRVALLPVVVHSSEGQDYLRQGLADMLVSRLGRDRRLAIVPVDDPKTATTDVDAARKSGQAASADWVVYGSFTRFGEGASLDLTCASVRDDKREPRQIYVHADSMGALIPLLDGVAERTTFTVLGGDAATPAVSSGPPVAGGGGDLELNELRRRVEALERAVFDSGAAAATHPAAGEEDKANKGAHRTAPGLPTDRDASGANR